MKIRTLVQKIFQTVVNLLALKTMQQKHIDFLNKNQCQKSAVINVSIIYFSHSTKGYLLQLKKTFPLRVSIQGVKSLGCHFASLCRGFDFYEVKKKLFQENTF